MNEWFSSFKPKKQTTTKFEIQFSIFKNKLCETKNSPGVELIWYLKLSQNINKQSEQKNSHEEKTHSEMSTN